MGLIHCLHSGLVRLAVLLLDKVLDERQTLAHVLGSGLDLRNGELGLDSPTRHAYNASVEKINRPLPT